MGEFNDKVYETVRRVPRGKVVSYGQVARLIGQPRKARFVGYAMHGNPDPWDCAAQTGIPCHRVVFKDGSLAPGFAFGGPDEQRARLAAEGVTFLDDGRVDMRACQWNGRDAGGADGGAAADVRPRRRSISIGPLSWANKRLVLAVFVAALFGPQAFHQGTGNAQAVAGCGHDAACIARTFAARVKAGFGLESGNVGGLPVGGC